MLAQEPVDTMVQFDFWQHQSSLLWDHHASSTWYFYVIERLNLTVLCMDQAAEKETNNNVNLLNIDQEVAGGWMEETHTRGEIGTACLVVCVCVCVWMWGCLNLSLNKPASQCIGHRLQWASAYGAAGSEWNSTLSLSIHFCAWEHSLIAHLCHLHLKTGLFKFSTAPVHLQVAIRWTH
jgi:hypothetical protein